jgi:hypothetical protein
VLFNTLSHTSASEINRLSADVESLDSEAQRLQSAINRSDTAIIEEILRDRDVTELKKTEEACQALQAAGDKHSELLQQVVLTPPSLPHFGAKTFIYLFLRLFLEWSLCKLWSIHWKVLQSTKKPNACGS